MGATNLDGPLFVDGDLQAIPASVSATGAPVPDPNQDAGPSGFYQGYGFPDVRLWNPKDKVQGFTGVLQHHMPLSYMKSIGGIPTALASNNIAAAQNAVQGVAMTLAAGSLGITTNVPIRPFGFALGGNAPVNAAIALEFGFAFGNCTSGSAAVTVLDSTFFAPGMPLVIGGVGNAAGTTPLLTQVATIVDATHITLLGSALPAFTNAAAPIGTGDLWGPSEIGFPLPMGAYPFLARGPGLFMDPRQSMSRGVSITGVSGGAGGTFTVTGWDVYNQPMAETITVAAGASTGYSKKCFKYIASVTPTFADAHNYSVGNADLFGFNYRSRVWEDTTVFWAGAPMTSATGWVAASLSTPSTAITGDVRGTIQLTASGPGSGIGSTASNGSLSGISLTGNRLELNQVLNVPEMLRATRANASSIFGQPQNLSS